MMAPVDLADCVETWARGKGTHARLGWSTLLRCWVIDLELSDEHPRTERWRAGELKRRPTESIPLHAWDKDRKAYIALPIEEWGASGLVERLEKADMLSGRGEYDTLAHALAANDTDNEAVRHAQKEYAVAAGVERAMGERRRIFDLPLVSVPREIGGEDGD